MAMLRRLLFVLAPLALIGCAERGDVPPAPPETAAVAYSDHQEAWWSHMMMHCDRAFEGGLSVAPPGDEMLQGDELLLVHFRECTDDELRLPFHIEKAEGEWDRSRTWIFSRHEESIELRHDHRTREGEPDESTMYGGFTQTPGSANQQVFIFTDYEEYDPAGPKRGWRVEIEPNVRYTYGTFRGEDWRWRVDFDLSSAVAPPPAPWGHE
jgi:hypothetical protein